MAIVAITADRIFDGSTFHEGAALLVDNSRIVGIASREAAQEATDTIPLPAGSLLAPGFIDVQVNGGGGVLFNDEPNVPGLKAIARAHRRFGTTGLLPTLISDTRDAIRRAIDAVADAIEKGVPGILGVHLEGPFINPSRKGAHPEERIVPIEETDLDLLSALGPAGVTMVTLAPERVPAEFIAELSRRGVVVSLGHTDATGTEATAAFAAGARCVTHLFNAMSQLGSREPGLVGAAMADARPFVGIIADGHHVSDLSLRVAAKAIGPERLMIITDAMPTVGTTLEEFTLLGRATYVRGGKLILADGTLAGAHLDMASAVRQMTDRAGVDLADALRMASATPARCLGLESERGKLLPGSRVDLVALSADRTVIATWIDGQMEKA